LLSADRLGALLDAADLLVLDASWYLPTSGRDADADYRAAHIPGAVRVRLEDLSLPDGDLPHTIPTATQFAAACERHGIGPRHRIVVYDGSGSNLSAGRVWWLFRAFGHAAVSVLDGGILAWAEATRPIQSGLQRRPATGYPTPTLDTRLLVTKAEVEAIAAGEADGQIIDCRSAARFNGEVDEPRPGLRRGHIPGSANMPFESFTDPATGRMYPVPVLKEMFAARGLDLGRRLVATCGSGTSACVLALAVEVIRAAEPELVGPPVAIYDGSWSEWGRSAS
jgi:thiosulfate/3-mercaptopyruvate sulfurtransferase